MRQRLVNYKLLLSLIAVIFSCSISLYLEHIISLADDNAKIKHLAIMLFVINCIPFVILFYKKRIDFFNPLFIFAAAFFVFFPLRIVYIIWNNDYAFMDMIQANRNVMDEVLLVLIFSLLFLYAGYCSRLDAFVMKLLLRFKSIARIFKTPFQIAAHSRFINRYSNVLVFLAILGFVVFSVKQGSFMIGRGATRLAGENAYIYLSINLLIPGILLKFIHAQETGKKMFAVLILFIAACYLFMVLGGRYRLVMLLISFCILLFHYYKIRLGRFFMIAASVGFVYLISVIGASRGNLYLGSAVDLNFRPETIRHNFLSSTGDLNIFDTFVKVYEGIPELLNYQYGATFASLFIQPIPRSIFPEKPVYASTMIMEHLIPEFHEKGIGFAGSILADFMLNFGVLGIFIGMMTIGVLLKVVENFRQYHIQGVLFYSVTLSVIPFYTRGEFVGTSVWYLIVLLPSMLVFYLMSKPNVTNN